MKIIIILIFIIFFPEFNRCKKYKNLKTISEKTKSHKFNKINNKFSYISENHNLKKNLIIGAISGYSWETVAPFFKSIIKAKIQNYDCIIFVREISEMIIKKIKECDAIIYKIPEIYNNETIINIRWKLYFDFLNDKKDVYNIIFATDIKDTIFQKDVFKFYENKGSFLGLAIEDGTLQEEVNKKWVIGYIGEKLYETIKHERIICVGTIWGTLNKFMEFSNILYKTLSSHPSAIEQGVANFLFYHDKIFNNFILKSDNYGPVMTLALTKRSNLVLDKYYNILNYENEIAAVVHQYNRKPDLLKLFQKKFCPELFIYKSEKNNNQSEKLNQKVNIINNKIKIREAIKLRLPRKNLNKREINYFIFLFYLLFVL